MRINRILFSFIFGIGCFALWAAEESSTDKILDTSSVKLGDRKAQADRFYHLGLNEYKQRQYSEAAQNFAKALRMDPYHEGAQNYLIRVESVLGTG
ncbi:MAG: tetratricopeptide repeat protein, partial [Planctomycetes bacterium]|nr:tetratricopeptide repeat protein [Planctomycetota bacterium]